MTASKEAELTAGDSVESLTTGNRQLTTVVRNELKSVETEIKYAGYLDQQTKAIERLKRSEQRMIPDWFDYGKVSGLSREMNEKLTRVRPQTLGQASRIPGVTPGGRLANQRVHRNSGTAAGSSCSALKSGEWAEPKLPRRTVVRSG